MQRKKRITIQGTYPGNLRFPWTNPPFVGKLIKNNLLLSQ